MPYPLTGSTLTATGGVVISTPAPPVLRLDATPVWSGKLSIWTNQRTVQARIQSPAPPVLRVSGVRVWQASFGVLRPPTTGQLWPRGDRIVVG